MYDFLSRKFLVLYQSIHILGSHSLTQIILYSQLFALVWRSFNWSLGIFAIQFQHQQASSSSSSHLSTSLAQVFLSTYSSIGYFLDLSKLLIILLLFSYNLSTPPFLKKFIVISFILFEDNCFMSDMVTTKHYMASSSPYMIAYSIVSLLICASVRLFADLAMCNFSFEYPHVSKRIPLLKLKLIESVLQEVTCLFLMFVESIQGRGAFIIFVLLSVGNLIVRGGYMYSLPFSSVLITKLRLVKFVIWTSFVLSFILSHLHIPLITSNIWIVYLTFALLGSIVSLNYLKMTREKLLNTDIPLLPSWTSANTKLQYIYSIITEEKESDSRIVSLLKSHQGSCKRVECLCRGMGGGAGGYYDFRAGGGGHTGMLKYFLMVMCEEVGEWFGGEGSAGLYRVFGYSVLGMYPKVFEVCERLGRGEGKGRLKLNDRVIVEFMKWQTQRFLQQKNDKQRILNLEELIRIQTIFSSLTQKIQGVATHRAKIFQNLLEPCATPSTITQHFLKEIHQRTKLTSIISEIRNMPYKLPHISETILTYAKYIAEDYHLYKTFSVELQEKLKYNSLYNDAQIDSLNGLVAARDRSILLKVGLVDVGGIEYASVPAALQGKLPPLPLPCNISELLPSFYQSTVVSLMALWQASPYSSVLGHPFTALFSFKPDTLHLATVYLKLLPTQATPVLLCVLVLEEESEIVVMNEGLDMINYCGYLLEELREHEKEFNSVVNLGLLSKEVGEMVEKGEYDGCYEKEFNLFVPENYDVVYERYEREVVEMGGGEEGGEKQKERGKYFEMLRSCYEGICSKQNISIISFKGIINILDLSLIPLPFISSLPRLPHFIYIKSISPLTTTPSQQHLSYASPQPSLLSNSNHSLDCFVPNPSSSYSQRIQQNYSKLLKNNEFLQNKTFLLIKILLALAILLYTLTPYFSLTTSILHKHKTQKIYDASLAICKVASVCLNTYDMNALMSQQIQHELPYNHHLHTLLTSEINNLAEYIKVYSYQNDNEILKGFFAKSVVLENDTVVPFAMWMQTWVINMKELAKEYGGLREEGGGYEGGEKKIISLSFYRGSFLTDAMVEYRREYGVLLAGNNVMSGVVVLAGVLGVVLYVYYLYYFGRYEEKTMKLLEEIDLGMVRSYLDFYRYCKKNLWGVENQKSICFEKSPPHEPFPSSVPVTEQEKEVERRKKITNRPKFKPRRFAFTQWHMLVFFVVAVLLNQLLMKEMRERAEYSIGVFTEMVEFQRAEWYNIRSLSELKEVVAGVRRIQNASILQALVNNDFNHYSVSLKGVLLNQRLHKKITTYFTTPICELLSSTLKTEELHVCRTGFSNRVIDSGLLSFGDYVTNNVRSSYHKYQTQPSSLPLLTLLKDPKLVDSTLSFFFHQRALEEIQGKEVRGRVDEELGEFVGLVGWYLGVVMVIGVVAGGGLWRLLREERRKWGVIFEVPRLLPEKVARENAVVESFFNGFRKENRIREEG